MKNPPRKPGESILAGEWGSLVFASVLAFSFAFLLFLYLLSIGKPLVEARSVTLMMAITFELLLAHNVRSRRPLLQIGLFSNKWILWATAIPFALQFVLLYTPLAGLFHLVPISFIDWMMAIGIAVSGFALFEVVKHFQHSKLGVNDKVL